MVARRLFSLNLVSEEKLGSTPKRPRFSEIKISPGGILAQWVKFTPVERKVFIDHVVSNGVKRQNPTLRFLQVGEVVLLSTVGGGRVWVEREPDYHFTLGFFPAGLGRYCLPTPWFDNCKLERDISGKLRDRSGEGTFFSYHTQINIRHIYAVRFWDRTGKLSLVGQ